MKKKILLVCSYLLIFILAGCTTVNNTNTPTSYDLIDSLQIQMNEVVTTVRGLDVLYQEDYVIAPIYNSNYNYSNNLNNNINGYNNTYTTSNYGNNMMRGNYRGYSNIDTYGITPYNGYNNIFYGNYSRNGSYNNGSMFGNNYQNYSTNNYGSSVLPNNIDTYNSINTPVSNINAINDLDNNHTTNSVYNNYNTLNNSNFGSYVPKYSNNEGLDRTTLNAYVASLEDLYLITSDINSANYILNNLMINNIELAVAIRNNAFYLNYNVEALPADNLQVISEYVNTIKTILSGLNATYGYITTEVEGIAPLRESFYNNTEALNARYLKLINIIDSRIAQLQNLMVSLQRLNYQLLLVGNQNNQANTNIYQNQYVNNGVYGDYLINQNQGNNLYDNNIPADNYLDNTINSPIADNYLGENTYPIENDLDANSTPIVNDKNSPALDNNLIDNNEYIEIPNTNQTQNTNIPNNYESFELDNSNNDIADNALEDFNNSNLGNNNLQQEEVIINPNTGNISSNDNNSLSNYGENSFNNENNAPQQNTSPVETSENNAEQNRTCNETNECKENTNIFIEEYNSDTYFDTNRILSKENKKEGTNLNDGLEPSF